MRFLWYMALSLFSLGILGLIGGVGGVVAVISYYGRDLPDYRQLKDYEPPVLTRAYAGDGHLLAEFAQEKRVFVPVAFIPDLVKQAFIASEDKNFYSHQGVDYLATLHAMVDNLRGKEMRGASTITQQVAKNLLLSNERTYKRKIREAILSFRIEHAMSKDRILELYLNQIYLGEGTYGVAAAALNYFNKSLEELDISEVAFLAALPKAPNNYNPVTKHQAALDRRNRNIERMYAAGYITRSQADLARAKPLEVVRRGGDEIVNASYFAEEVRRFLIDRYGGDILYGGGMAVRTTVDPRLQDIATRTLRAGLVEYDRRHGYRGPVAHLDTLENWADRLAEVKAPGLLPQWRLAVVLSAGAGKADIAFADKSRGELLLKELTWARKGRKTTIIGPEIRAASDVLSPGDVVMTEQLKGEDGKPYYTLRQVPRVNGALVAIDPHTGRVLAMEGGWMYEGSEFNRATQAKRQPGSAFKPFVYLTALEKGFTPATLILDAPLVIDQGPGMPKWRPVNYSGEYYGPTPMRVGLEKSRNLMTVRMAEYIGMDSIIENAKKLGVTDYMEPHLANSLGSCETTLMRLTASYAQFVNGGRKVTPFLIDRIQDRYGKTVFTADDRPCPDCGALVEWEGQETPQVPDPREQLIDPRHAYQMASMLEGVVERGTAARIKVLKRPLAGKTGTTNESKDTWFIGFSPDLAVGVFVGMDQPESLGKKETGASAAVPVFRDFMKEALEAVPAMPFRVPPGIRQVQINADTGTRAKPGDAHVIWESFLTGTEPTDRMYMLGGSGITEVGAAGAGGVAGGESPAAAATTGTGGLY